MTEIDTSTEAVETLLKDALKFCDLAAGEGFILFGVSPEDFLFDYSKATGFEDWANIGQHIVTIMLTERDEYKRRAEQAEKREQSMKDSTEEARKLQRELNAMKRERDQLRDELDAAYAIIAAERGEVIKLREAVLKIANIGVAWSDTFESQIAQAHSIATEALSKKGQAND